MSDIFEYKNDFIYIRLHNGINMFEPLSAIGKSFLPIYCRNIGVPMPIVAIDTKEMYDNWMKGVFNKNTKSVIYFFDRADLFMSNELVKELSVVRDSIILVDSKNMFLMLKMIMCL